MIKEKWRARWRNTCRVLLWVAAIGYLLALYSKISSMQSDIDSIQSDVSSIQSDVSSTQSDVSSLQSDLSNIEDGTCRNDRLCP
jgi:septation ring formation regulator EzrA